MTPFIIPDQLSSAETADSKKIGFIEYQSQGDARRHQILFSQNVFSFLISGRKYIHQEQEPISFGESHFAILRAGRCLMTEVSSIGDYRSHLLFFSDEVLMQFKEEHTDLLSKATQKSSTTLVLPHDAYTRTYRHSLGLLSRYHRLTPALKRSKLDEILLYLLDKFPTQLANLLADLHPGPEQAFRQIVENNKHSQLSIKELAFLCHMSVSTFKRHFQRYYGMAPYKWMLQERMKLAAQLLRQHKSPMEIYADMGYDTYSNFAKAFKQYHRTSPRKFQSMTQQEQQMDVWK